VFYDIISRGNLIFEANSLEVIDNWDYDNQIYLAINTNSETVAKYILNDKIVMLGGMLNHAHQCGLIIEKATESIFSMSFWISTKELAFLSDDYVTSKNLGIYEYIVNTIIQLHDYYSIYLCAIGVETCFEYSESIELTIKNSRNVNCWIMSNKQNNVEAYDFSISEKSGLKILSRSRM